MAKPRTVTVKLTQAEFEMVLLALKWAEYDDKGPLDGMADPGDPKADR